MKIVRAYNYIIFEILILTVAIYVARLLTAVKIGIYYIKLKSHLSVHLSVFIFAVTLVIITQSSQHGLTWDLVCVTAVVSGTRMVVCMNFSAGSMSA